MLSRIALLSVFCLIHFFSSKAQNSVLEKGDWYKIEIQNSGVYKIDRNFLRSMGLPVNTLNPKALKIYGNQQIGILPQSNAADRPIDLIELSIVVVGEEDQKLDEEDYILFYALGPDKEIWTGGAIDYEINYYSDASYYFITYDGEQGKRIGDKNISEENTEITIESYDDYIIREDEESNLIASGRKWLDKRIFDGESKLYNYILTDVTSDILCYINLVSRSPSNSTVSILSDNEILSTVDFDPVIFGAVGTYALKARVEHTSFTIPKTNNLELKVVYKGNSNMATSYVDFFTLSFRRKLEKKTTQIQFRNDDAIGKVAEYEINNLTNDDKVWNVSNTLSPSRIILNFEDNNGSFKSKSSDSETFVLFDTNTLNAPTFIKRLANQNLQNDVMYDGIIIVNSDMLYEANRLASFHKEHDHLRIKVVEIEKVYNEFSSGRQDITAIRDYIRHLYLSSGGVLKYLLLFGDCSYDYKDRVINNTNIIPTYESYQSFNPIYSFSSDDYFGFLEEDEGEWLEQINSEHTLDIGIGRIPVKDSQEAKAVVDKIIYYATSSTILGDWKTSLTYVADDEDFNIHMQQSETLFNLLDTTNSEYNVSKIYIDAYKQTSNNSGDFSLEAFTSLNSQITKGTFLVNFMGHGNEYEWTEEEVLTGESIDKMNNLNKLPIFITATCEFGRSDDPSVVSGAEKLLLKHNGGAIALLTTGRPVFASTNFELNKAQQEVFFKKEDGMYQRLGDIIKKAKNKAIANSNNGNIRVNRTFSLLGDPMLTPAFPKLNIDLNHNNAIDTLSALEKVQITGSIKSGDQLYAQFNGTVSIAIYNAKEELVTQGEKNPPFNYETRNNTLFQGLATVKNGVFSFELVVPKNISNEYVKGKIQLYAKDNSLNIDAISTNTQVILGGITENTIDDTSPPIIEMYLNDPSFHSGNTVGSSSTLIAKMSDENGPSTFSDTSKGNMVLTINENVFDVTEFYTSDLDTYQKGTLTYPIQNLPSGLYHAILEVSDVYQNVSTQKISFNVSEEPVINIFNQSMYPNPAQDHFTISFEHDRIFEELVITNHIFNIQGEKILTDERNIISAEKNINLHYNFLEYTNQPLKEGMYFYKIIIMSKKDQAVKEIHSKFVIN